jgi:hypothetical protein
MFMDRRNVMRLPLRLGGLAFLLHARVLRVVAVGDGVGLGRERGALGVVVRRLVRALRADLDRPQALGRVLVEVLDELVVAGVLLALVVRVVYFLLLRLLLLGGLLLRVRLPLDDAVLAELRAAGLAVVAVGFETDVPVLVLLLDEDLVLLLDLLFRLRVVDLDDELGHGRRWTSRSRDCAQVRAAARVGAALDLGCPQRAPSPKRCFSDG